MNLLREVAEKHNEVIDQKDTNPTSEARNGLSNLLQARNDQPMGF